MSDEKKKKWNYNKNEGRYGWYDDYLLPGEHRGQPSHRGAVARNRIHDVSQNTGLSHQSVMHNYDLHQYDDQPGEPTASSTKAQQKNAAQKKFRNQLVYGSDSAPKNPKGLNGLDKFSGTASKKAKDKLQQKSVNSNAKKVLQDAFNKKKKGK